MYIFNFPAKKFEKALNLERLIMNSLLVFPTVTLDMVQLLSCIVNLDFINAWFLRKFVFLALEVRDSRKQLNI